MYFFLRFCWRNKAGLEWTQKLALSPPSKFQFPDELNSCRRMLKNLNIVKECSKLFVHKFCQNHKKGFLYMMSCNLCYFERKLWFKVFYFCFQPIYIPNWIWNLPLIFLLLFSIQIWRHWSTEPHTIYTIIHFKT